MSSVGVLDLRWQDVEETESEWVWIAQEAKEMGNKNNNWSILGGEFGARIERSKACENWGIRMIAP